MKRLILFLVTVVCFACKSTQYYYHPSFIEKNLSIEKDYVIDYKRVNASTCHVVDSLIGHFVGQKGRATLIDVETDPRIFISVRLDLDADGGSFLSESFDLFGATCTGVWCMTDSTIQITCNANKEITDTIIYLFSTGSFIYGDIDVKVLDKDKLLLKNGTVLYRTE